MSTKDDDAYTKFREAWGRLHWETNRGWSALTSREASKELPLDEVLRHHQSALMAAEQALALLAEHVFGRRPSPYDGHRLRAIGPDASSERPGFWLIDDEEGDAHSFDTRNELDAAVAAADRDGHIVLDETTDRPKESDR